MLTDAVRLYHDLLTPDLAADTQEALDSQLRLRGLVFGTRPVCTVLRPRFITQEQYDWFQQRVALLMPAFNKAHRAALADPAFRAQFRLSPVEDQLATLDPGFRCHYPTSRLDAFFVNERGFKFTEYNSETPAGAGYSDVLADVFRGLPAMREFLKTYQAVWNPCRPGIVHTLLDAFHQWAGRRDKPRVAILDWREVPTFNEFVIFEKYFHNHGVECVIADPREVEYKGGKLWAGNFHVTLIYKRVLISELLEKGGAEHPVVRAVRDRAVCMVNPFPCKILYKKASFAVLTDERNAHLFSDAEKEALAAHVPWTRVLEERKTTHGGRTVDLVPHVLRNKDWFVLKPNDDYGGKGITLGWTVDQAAWEQAVKHALTEPYVVQEKVGIPSEPYPSLVDGQVQVIDRMLDTAPYVSYGEFMDSVMTRLSTAELLNVTAGGGSTVPTFVIAKR